MPRAAGLSHREESGAKKRTLRQQSRAASPHHSILVASLGLGVLTTSTLNGASLSLIQR